MGFELIYVIAHATKKKLTSTQQVRLGKSLPEYQHIRTFESKSNAIRITKGPEYSFLNNVSTFLNMPW